MPKETAWSCVLISSPYFACLKPVDQKIVVEALTLGTRTLRDFVPSVLYGLN